MSEITQAQSARPDHESARNRPHTRPTTRAGAPCAAIGWVVSTKRLDGDGVSQTELRRRDGQATTVSEKAITALGDVLRGRLVQPSDPDYEDARAVWNGMVDKHPALIVRGSRTSSRR